MSAPPDGSPHFRLTSWLKSVRVPAPDEDPLRASLPHLVGDLALIEEALRATPALAREGDRATINPDLIALREAKQRIVSELGRRAVPHSITRGGRA